MWGRKLSPGRVLNKVYKERLIQKVLLRFGCRLFLPAPLLKLRIGLKSLSFLKKGLGSLRKGRLEVEVLDAAAITAHPPGGFFYGRIGHDAAGDRGDP